MANWLKELYDELDTLRDITHDIDYLSEAFRITGNRDAAEKLYLIARAIYASKENINRIASQKVNDDVREAQQSFYGTMNSIVKENKDESTT